MFLLVVVTYFSRMLQGTSALSHVLQLSLKHDNREHCRS